MESDLASHHPFVIGEWSVDPASGCLNRAGQERRLRPQVMDLLVRLAERPGDTISKADLLDAVWGARFVSESALTTAIAELRDALEDDAKEPRFIQTVPKRGYRLVSAISAALPVALAAPIDASGPVEHRREAEDDVPRGAMPPPPPPMLPLAATADDRVRWSRTWTLAFVLGVAFAIAVTVSLASRRRPAEAPTAAAAPSAMRLTVDLPSGLRLTSDNVPRLALTTDGARLAYVVRSDAGRVLYTRTLDQFDSHPVPGTDDASAPFFSPDGSRLGYFANGELRTIPVGGGVPVIVCQARVALGAAWAPDDTIIFSGAHGLGLFTVPAAGGSPSELTTLDRSRGELSHRWPQVVPDGQHVLFTALGRDRADVVLLSRRTGERRIVLEHAQAATFVPPDRLLFERDGRLLQAPIDGDRFAVTGPPRTIVEDVSPAGPGFGPPLFAAATGGALVYVPNDPHEAERELVWVDRTGRVSSLGTPPRSYMHPRLSSDGHQILTWLRTRDPDLWLFDVASRALTRLVTGVSGRRAAWSPDGLRVMFDAPGPDNPITLYEADVRDGRTRRLREDKNSQYAGTWTPDGRTIAFLDLRKATGFDIVTMGDGPDAQTKRLLRSAANETAPAFSPDGRWLAYVSDVSGREEVYLLSYAAGGAPVQVSRAGGREPVWSTRGDELFFRQDDSMCAVQVTGTDRPRVSDPSVLFAGEFDKRPLFPPNYDVAADGRFLMIRGIAPSTTDTRIADPPPPRHTLSPVVHPGRARLISSHRLPMTILQGAGLRRRVD